jgi:acyl carrier protein
MPGNLTKTVSEELPPYMVSAIMAQNTVRIDEVTRQTPMLDVCTESIDYIDFTFRLEHATGLKLDRSRVADLATVGAVADYVDKAIKERWPPRRV